VPDPGARWRLDLKKAAYRGSREPIAGGCPCPACREHTRGYLHYLARANELTAARLITLHNLTFMALLMEQIREAIATHELEAYAGSALAGQRPY
jgi:queuine tRNA-ribosyltransferase